MNIYSLQTENNDLHRFLEALILGTIIRPTFKMQRINRKNDENDDESL